MPVRFLRDPLFVFVAAGLTLYALYFTLSGRQDDPIVLAADTRTALIVEFQSLTGRTASPADIARIEQEYIADELLFRAALADGLHLTDGAVRRQLIQKMRLRATGVLPDPSTEELLDYYSDHLDRYHTEPTASFEQVYFTASPADAAVILERLRRNETVSGDAFKYGFVFDRYGRSMIRGMFGEPFVAALWGANQGEWIGPLQTQHGWHFVRVSALAAPALRAFPDVRNQVENDWIEAQIQDAVDRKVTELKPGHAIRIER